MSALLQGVPIRVSGAIQVTVGTVAPDHVSNGIPYEADGAVSVATTGAIDHYHQGLPYTAAGRLATVAAAPTYFGSGAAPFNATGRLCTGTGVDHVSSGVGYAANGSIAVV
jgi:hypothetical protein